MSLVVHNAFYSIILGVKALQTEEGNFAATLSGCESDMRFVYCAACISYMLDDWSGFNIERATDYIIKSIVSILATVLDLVTGIVTVLVSRI